MSDQITATGSNKKYLSHPVGQFAGQCVDIVGLGEAVKEYPGQPPSLAPVAAIVFRTGEKNPDTGDVIDIAQEFTVSMGDKANLRKFLESWRGKPYTPDQVKEGVPLHKLTGNWALLTVAHKTSKAGNTYAVIQSAVPLPAVMRPAQDFAGYKRAEYWATKKEKYAKEAQDFRAHAPTMPSEQTEEEYLDAEPDELPF